jgi:[ribosomal protein S5]-alanine N-acetyltransferase
MELNAGVCAVRSWQWSDQESLAHHANSRQVWLNLRDRFPHPYTLTDARRWLRSVARMAPETEFAIAVNGEAVGGIGVTLQDDVFRFAAEIGYWLGEAYWGRGIATAVVRTVTAYAFTAYDLRRLSAGVFEWNPASRRVLEKAGYTLEGHLRYNVLKDGKFIDQFLYAIVRGDVTAATEH